MVDPTQQTSLVQALPVEQKALETALFVCLFRLGSKKVPNHGHVCILLAWLG